jgi:isopentenyl-diphosphate delta-isomerase
VAAIDPSPRKADHLRIAAGPGVLHRRGSGLEELRLRHRALPGRNLDDVSLETDVVGARLAAPLLISAMTGGTAEATELNDRLARAAAECGVGMTLGSGRALLDDPDLLRTYRGATRPPLLLANCANSTRTADLSMKALPPTLNASFKPCPLRWRSSSSSVRAARLMTWAFASHGR